VQPVYLNISQKNSRGLSFLKHYILFSQLYYISTIIIGKDLNRRLVENDAGREND